MQQQVLAETVRVAVHSSDELTRVGLVSYLHHDRRLSLTETAGDADVMVVAADVANASTLGLLRRLAEDTGVEPGTMNFVVVVGRRWEADVSAAVDCGVRAVVSRGSCAAAEFVQTLIAVAHGGGSLPAPLQGALMEQVRMIQREVLAPRGLSASGVSAREVDVLRLLAEGWELADIAEKLCFSERTIKYVLYGLMKRLDLRNRAHAVSYAIRTGLI
ncbi:helix-turn-helix transcriptional regulator [Streptomyces griseorubiginosus]|uniref:LuxR family transcriptional regulator n=1 Tax=Streptomyces griseorubiginosus TaxID=67304 RepID=A0A124HVR8_9ACTN|nr:response regulator transcription factor [Streptomyces griseorubiginosus]KUN59310.1 LuxR family transcriptional regulator [Streptomyces griseorubiginosus]